jgi:hypothetical protein
MPRIWKCARPVAWLAIVLLVVVLCISNAQAHGAVGIINRCVLRIGPDLMFFAGYQPQSSREEFCDDMPDSGQTVFVLDMIETELRDMLTEIRIIKDEGNHTTMNGLPYLTDAELASPQVLDPMTITHVPPKKYPTGTLTVEHTFPVGKFIGIVMVTNDHGQKWVSQFPFSVGQASEETSAPAFTNNDFKTELAATARKELASFASNILAATICKSAKFNSEGVVPLILGVNIALNKEDAQSSFFEAMRKNLIAIRNNGESSWCAETLKAAKARHSQMLTSDDSLESTK